MEREKAFEKGFLPFFVYWGIPPDPNLSFSLAQRKELKETSTPTKPSCVPLVASEQSSSAPILGGLICCGGKPPSAKVLASRW